MSQDLTNNAAVMEALSVCRGVDFDPRELSGRVAFLRSLAMTLEEARLLKKDGYSKKAIEQRFLKKIALPL